MKTQTESTKNLDSIIQHFEKMDVNYKIIKTT